MLNALYNRTLITVLADRRRPERAASIILRQADDARQEPKVCRLAAGGKFRLIDIYQGPYRSTLDY